MAEPDTPGAPDAEAFTDDSPDPAGDAKLAALCDALHRHGVRRVTVRYEGCGDSGGVEEVECVPESVRPPRDLEDQLREAAESYCPDGYENNDGGYGTPTVHVAEGLAALEHTDRWEDSEGMGVSTSSLPHALRERLTSLGVTSVTADFDGYGDSGQIEGVAAEPGGVTLDGTLRVDLEDFLLGLLPGGWENNEGGFGGFTIDVASGTVEADALWRVEKDSDTQVTRWKWRP